MRWRTSITGSSFSVFLTVLGFAQIFYASPIWANENRAKEKLRPSDSEYISRVAEKRASTDFRKFKAITLSNGLEVLLVQDPKAVASSAVLSVGAGSLLDPVEYAGLAHSVEHMVFLGTQKYPEPGEFDAFLSRNGGKSNAHTQLENTTYYFSVNNSSFSEALDRFGQMFYKPLFLEKLIESEVKNIHSEYTKKMDDSNIRRMHLLTVLADPSHPFSRYFQGNSETLGRLSKRTLFGFFDRYYSANIMKLVIVSSLGLDYVEKIATEVFSPIPNQHVAVPDFGFQVVQPENLPEVISMKSPRQEYQLDLVFFLPSQKKNLVTKPHSLFGKLLDLETEGSLEHLLKAHGLITDMATYVTDDRFRTEVRTVFKLSREGYRRWKDVVRNYFAYIEMLKENGVSETLYSEFQKTHELKYIFDSEFSGGSGGVDFAEAMHDLPISQVESLQGLFIRHSPKRFRAVLAQIVPEKAQILLTAPDIIADKKAKLYPIEYRVERPDSETLEEWKKARSGGLFKFPPPNPYLPEDISSRGENQKTPIEVRSDLRQSLWVQAENSFNRPNAKVAFEVIVPKPRSLSERAMKVLYLATIEESLKRWSFPAGSAGISFEIESSDTGYRLVFSGYADKIELFAKDIISHLTQIDMGETRFLNLRSDLIQEIQNEPSNLAYRRAISRLSILMNPSLVSQGELLPYLAEISLSQLQAFSRSIFRKAYLRGFAFGHVRKELITALADLFLERFRPEQFIPGEIPIKEQINLPRGSDLVHSLQAEGFDSGWVVYYQFGKTNPKRTAAICFGEKFMEVPFYTEMRTHQSLGYVVLSSPRVNPISSGVLFSIQSNRELAEVVPVAEQWLEMKVRELATMSDLEFESRRRSFLEEADQPKTSFDSQFALFSEAIFSYDGDWDWEKKMIEAIRVVTPAEVSNEWVNAFNPTSGRKLTIRVNGKDKASERR